MHDKAILVVGAEGSGKTFLSSKLSAKGVNAIDTDSVSGLSKWIDMKGNKVRFPVRPSQKWFKTHKFCIDEKKLRVLIKKRPVVVFALSHNIPEITEMFDEIYYLKVSIKTLDKRLRKRDGKAYSGIRQLEYVKKLDTVAKKKGFTILNGASEPEVLLSVITRHVNMESNITISEAKRSDSYGVTDLYYELYPKRQKGGIAKVGTPLLKSKTFVAREGNKVVGFLLATFTSYGKSRYGYIEELVVTKKARGKNIGSKLVKEALAWENELGAEVVHVTTDDAQGFYKKIGFRNSTENSWFLWTPKNP